MLSCVKYKKLLLPYTEDALDERERHSVEAHLRKCSACSEELDALRAISRTLRQADVPAAEPAPDLWMRVQSVITEPVTRRRPWWQPPSYQIASAVGVATVMLFAVLAVRTPLHYDEASRTKSPAKVMQQESRQSKPEVSTPGVEISKGVKQTARSPRSSVSVKPESERVYAGRQHSVVDEPVVMSEAPDTGKTRGVTSSDLRNRALRESKDSYNEEKRGYYDDKDADMVYDASPARPLADTTTLNSAKPPFNQAGRVPGGAQSQMQAHDGSEQPFFRGGGNGAAESVEQPKEVGDASKSFDKLENKESVRVASAPSAATGSVVNVAPSVLGDSSQPVTKLKRDADKAGAPPLASAKPAASPTESARTRREVASSGGIAPSRKPAQAKGTSLGIDTIGVCERIAQSRPNDAKNWLELGRAYQQKGLKDKARAAFKKAAAKGNALIKKEAEAELRKLDAAKQGIKK